VSQGPLSSQAKTTREGGFLLGDCKYKKMYIWI